MWRKCVLWAALAAAVWGSSPPAHAQAMEAVGFGGKALEWIGITPDQVGILTNLLESSKQVAEHTNELLNYARASRQAVETLRNPSFEELQQESQARLLEAFPELRQINAEVDKMVSQGNALWDGVDTQVGSRHNQATRLAKFAGEAALWPQFFARARHKADYKPSPTDLFVQQRYQDTHMAQQRAYRSAVVQSLLAQTDALYRDSLRKDDMLVRSEAIVAQASVQTMSDTGEMVEQKRQDIAIEEQKKAESEGHRRALLKLLAKHASFVSSLPRGS